MLPAGGADRLERDGGWNVRDAGLNVVNLDGELVGEDLAWRYAGQINLEQTQLDESIRQSRADEAAACAEYLIPVNVLAPETAKRLDEFFTMQGRKGHGSILPEGCDTDQREAVANGWPLSVTGSSGGRGRARRFDSFSAWRFQAHR